jgi:hypothetical protein
VARWSGVRVAGGGDQEQAFVEDCLGLQLGGAGLAGDDGEAEFAVQEALDDLAVVADDDVALDVAVPVAEAREQARQ